MRIHLHHVLSILSLLFATFTLAFYFSFSNTFVQEEDITLQKEKLFSQRTNTCKRISSIPLLFDKKEEKNTYTLCKMGFIKYCLRRSPAEEQEYFYVVCPIYSVNQQASTLIYQLHTNFKNYCEALGVKFTQVEYAFPFQDFILTKAGNEPFDIQIPGYNIFYLRENLVNVAEKKLPKDYEYISWIDAHAYFDNPYVFQDTIVQLGKHNVVAPFSLVKFKDKRNSTDFITQYPFVYQAYYSQRTPTQEIFPFYGLAFATKRHIFQGMNGLPDLCIAGICDVYMSLALTNGTTTKNTDQLKEVITNWIKNAANIIEGKFGYVKSTFTHFDHYFPLRKQSDWGDAIRIMEARNFNVSRDLKRDKNGTLYFVNNMELAYDFWKMYFSI